MARRQGVPQWACFLVLPSVWSPHTVPEVAQGTVGCGRRESTSPLRAVVTVDVAAALSAAPSFSAAHSGRTSFHAEQPDGAAQVART